MTVARLALEPATFGTIFDMFTGLRLGELCDLRWGNVDMESRSFLPNHDGSIVASTIVKTTLPPRQTTPAGLFSSWTSYSTILRCTGVSRCRSKSRTIVITRRATCSVRRMDSIRTLHLPGAVQAVYPAGGHPGR